MVYFADLHFHTHYSDNRDYASIEKMMLEGLKHSISVFGIADHNHSLDSKKWQHVTDFSFREYLVSIPSHFFISIYKAYLEM